jgi:succinyl-diaminopimelate desuccinylase
VTAAPVTAPLDLSADAVALTERLVDVPSVSGDERALADLVAAALRGLPGLEVVRDGDAVLARTQRDRGRRVLLAGHLDTVPIADNVPSRREGDRLFGCGTSDMKAALAVMLRIVAADAAAPDASPYDLTVVFYDQEEVAAVRNGLGRLARTRRAWLDCDLALLMEPTSGLVEAGCQGTLRVVTTVPGRRAHTARAWLGQNAIHAAAPLLATLAAYEPRSVTLDGCTYREGLSAVQIGGGVAGNVVPDACTVTVNFRFAPDRTEEQALAHVREVLPAWTWELTDTSPGALPGLGAPLAQEFVATVGSAPVAKYGWTDVSRFAALGIPALNFGPGDPNLAHTRDESVETALIGDAEDTLRRFLRLSAA